MLFAKVLTRFMTIWTKNKRSGALSANKSRHFSPTSNARKRMRRKYYTMRRHPFQALLGAQKRKILIDFLSV